MSDSITPDQTPEVPASNVIDFPAPESPTDAAPSPTPADQQEIPAETPSPVSDETVPAGAVAGAAGEEAASPLPDAALLQQIIRRRAEAPMAVAKFVLASAADAIFHAAGVVGSPVAVTNNADIYSPNVEGADPADPDSHTRIGSLVALSCVGNPREIDALRSHLAAVGFKIEVKKFFLSTPAGAPEASSVGGQPPAEEKSSIILP